MRTYEVLDGVALVEPGRSTLSLESKLDKAIIEVCKPILEESSNGSLEFVHFSAKE